MSSKSASSNGERDWPIVNDNRREAIFYAVVFGSVTIALAAVSLAQSTGTWTALLSSVVMLSFFGALLVAQARTSGRARFTPTAVLYVPLIGRPRWIAFEDVGRFRLLKNTLVLDVGRRISVPWNRMNFGLRPARVAKDQLRGWLSHYFDVDVAPRTWVWTVKRILFGVIVFGFILLQPFMMAQVRRLLVPLTLTVTAHASNYAKSAFAAGVGLVPLLLWFGVFYGGMWACDRLLGLGLYKANAWHYPRQTGHGFEVEVGAVTPVSGRENDLV